MNECTLRYRIRSVNDRWILQVLTERVDYIEGCINITLRTGLVKLEPESVSMIDICQMQDFVFQGDEEFHILHCQQSFWLIGPFVDGALGAIDELQVAHPRIPLRHAFIQAIPKKMRNPGFLGLRLLPIAGLGKFAISDLPPLKPQARESYRS